MIVVAQGPRQGWAHRGLRVCCVLAQALQFCLGLGMAKGPQSPWEPAVGTTVLLFVGRVETTHAEWAEEAAFCPSMALHQGLQAGELRWQVLGRKVLNFGPLPHRPCVYQHPTPPLVSHHVLAIRKAEGYIQKGRMCRNCGSCHHVLTQPSLGSPEAARLDSCCFKASTAQYWKPVTRWLCGFGSALLEITFKRHL